MSDASIISISHLSKRFGNDVTAVDDVSLDVSAGEFFALLGPSGCGKTTLLRIIAGLEVPSEGALLIDGEDMLGAAPNRRPVNMVFQSYAVFPHMTVAENVAYGLKVTGVARAEIEQRVSEALSLVMLAGLEARRPDQLSGGQRQRVALARALVKRPKVLLLDEPLSALDAKLREAMQLELVRLQHSVGITFVIVTHDQDEALSMADRIAVMDRGRVLQVAPPAELYEYPNCRFVADFIGKMNLFEARVVGVDADKLALKVYDFDVVPDGKPLLVRYSGVAKGDIGIAVRPEKIKLSETPPSENSVGFRGRVTEVAYYGSESHVYLENEAGISITVNVTNEARRTTPAVSLGQALWIAWQPEDTLVLVE